MQNTRLWRYSPLDSEVHKLNSIFKILSLVIMIVSSFFINSFEDIIMFSSYLVLALAYSGVNIKVYLREISQFRILLFFILIIDVLSFSSLIVIISDVFRVIFIILYVSLFIHVTSTNEILYGVEKVFSLFNNKKRQNIALYVSLIFRFPSFYRDEFLKIKRIYRRKIIKEKLLKKLCYYKSIIRLSFDLSIRRLNNALIYMRVKLYGYGKSRNNYRFNRFGIKEILLLILNIIILLIVIFY